MNNNKDFNNINKTSQEIGVGCNINNNNINSLNTGIDNTNFINYMRNEVFQNKDINEEIQNGEEEEEEEEEDENRNEEENDNNSNYNLVEKENFSQQVDFLFHPENPEYLPSKNKTQKKIIKKKSRISSEKVKKKKSKNKNKNKNKKGNKTVNKIRPEFNLCTKIDPQPKTESLFYGPTRDETRYEKQLLERAQKIAEYEENFWRQKEIYKAKRKKEEEELKSRYNYIKSRTSNNFYSINKNQKEGTNYEFLKNFKNISKVDFPNTDIRRYECNPQNYDAIIHSLLSEISDIKFQRKQENEQFINQIRKLQIDLDVNKSKKKFVKKRPKTGNKIKNNKKNYNSCNAVNNINYKKRAKAGNKLKNKISINLSQKAIENEIPVVINSNKNESNSNYYNNEKEKILKNIQDLELQKSNKKMEIIEQYNKINDKNNDNNLNKYENKSNINDNNLFSINYSQNKYISQNVNIYQNPTSNSNNNIYKNINKNILNYQDKMQILSELNNNLSKFSSGIPKLVNKVNQTLDKIYGKSDNPIKNAINNHPFVVLVSKSAFQMIKNNSEIILERMIDDLLIDCIYDLQNIEKERRKISERNNFIKLFNEARKALHEISKKEKEILNKY